MLKLYLKLAKKYSLYNKVLYTQCVRAHKQCVCGKTWVWCAGIGTEKWGCGGGGFK